jgi:hypothetical protein
MRAKPIPTYPFPKRQASSYRPFVRPSLDKPLELIEYFNTTARFQLMATHVRLAAIRIGDALGSDEQMALQRTKRIREQLGAFV